MTHDHRSAGSWSALAVLAAWARARLRFGRKHDKAAVSATADGWVSTDRLTEVSGPVSHQSMGTRPRRYTDAVTMIDLRVSNPSGIANAIVVACREVQAEGGSVRADVAVRLMVTQLAWACGATGDAEDYNQLVAICRLRAISW